MYKIDNIAILCVVFAFCCVIHGQQSSCEPVNGQRRRCMPINDCQPLASIINNPKRTQREIDLLKSSHCGFINNVPAVCCPWKEGERCYTPEGTPGKCLGLKSCRHLQRLLLPPLNNNKMYYVERSKCEGPDQFSMCCSGTTPDLKPVQKGKCADKMNAFPPDPVTQCCGSDSSIKNKIYGGNMTAIDQYPWLVVIEYEKNGLTNTLCSGILISGRYILTAAHCVQGPLLEFGTPKSIRLGDYDITHEGPDCVPAEPGVCDCNDEVIRVPIEKIIPHPEHNATLRIHDIALIRMAQVAPFTDFIRPICLPQKNVTRKTTPFKVTLTGWGAVSTTMSSSSIKMHVEMPFVIRAQCQQAYQVPGRRVNIMKSHICAGGEMGKGVCKGDTGPLMYENDGTYEVVGIPSFGPTPCGLANVPGVYTNVYEYHPWIRSNIVP